MELHDQHLHSHHSFDCQTKPRDNVLSAIGRGLAGLTFTEHFDTHPDEWPGCRYDDAAYSDTIALLRNEFGDRIFVGKGIEVCYQPDRMDFILDFLKSHDFDVVVLSVHWAAGRSIWSRDRWEEWAATDGTRIYLETVLQATELCRELLQQQGRGCFDILGHLDLVKRYTHRFFDKVCVQQFNELIDRIMLTCVEAELIPEINTSTLRQGLTEPMPGPAVIRHYSAAGGRAMTLGSDAHRADDIAADFDSAVRMLGASGITHQAVFERRQPRLVPLNATVRTA